jgi:hypothetical protein
MRQGYRPYMEAAAWMRQNKGRDVSTQIGGVMNAGIHVATVIEKWEGKDFTEFIFRSTDNLLHKERCFGRGRLRYQMGSKYKFELTYGEDGDCRIEAAGGIYRLLHLHSGSHIYEAPTMKDLYIYVKEHAFRLAYLKIKWSREA